LPISLGYHLANTTLDEPELRAIAYKIGYLFQAQDDFLDCCAKESATGKSSCDIAEGKCTWITCQLLSKLGDNSEKRALFLQHFGKEEGEHVRAAKAIVFEYGVKEDFERFRSTFIAELHKDINNASGLAKIHDLLHTVLDEEIAKDKRSA